MVYADHETRVGAHRIFSVVLIPSSISPHQSNNPNRKKATDFHRTLSRNVSVFSSSAALFDKLGKEQSSSQESTSTSTEKKIKFVGVEDPKPNNMSMLSRLKSSYSRAYSVKKVPSPANENMSNSDKEPVRT